jgi:hypothetical protein
VRQRFTDLIVSSQCLYGRIGDRNLSSTLGWLKSIGSGAVTVGLVTEAEGVTAE